MDIGLGATSLVLQLFEAAIEGEQKANSIVRFVLIFRRI
jgi:hypothetical protein